MTVKSLSGGSYTATQNPPGAVAKSNQNAATQPPTVIVQATTSLPIKSAGDSCVAATTGTSPNLSADEGTAITSDRSTLLTCQSGTWKTQSGAGIIAFSSDAQFGVALKDGSAVMTSCWPYSTHKVTSRGRYIGGRFQTKIDLEFSPSYYGTDASTGWIESSSATFSHNSGGMCITATAFTGVRGSAVTAATTTNCGTTTYGTCSTSWVTW